MPDWKDLTPKQRNDYINQDYISLREMHVDNIENFVDDYPENEMWDIFHIRDSNHLKQLIIGFHLEGKSSVQISQYLPCSRQYCNLVIREYNDLPCK